MGVEKISTSGHSLRNAGLHALRNDNSRSNELVRERSVQDTYRVYRWMFVIRQSNHKRKSPEYHMQLSLIENPIQEVL